MRDRRQSLDQRGQRGIDERQRIAAAEDHFVDRRRRPRSRRAPAANRRATAALRRRESGGGSSSGNGRHTCRSSPSSTRPSYLCSSPGCRVGRVVVDRIGHEARHVGQFVGQRQHLPQQRVGRVARPHPGHETARHEQRKLSAPPPWPRPPIRPASPAAGTIRPDRGPRPSSRPATRRIAAAANLGRTTGGGVDRIVIRFFSKL